MLDANYQKHFKTLGKLCRINDAGSGADLNTLKQRVCRLFDQVASGEIDSYGGMLALSGYPSAFDGVIGQLNPNIQNVAKEAARCYLTSAHFRGDLTTIPSEPNSSTSVLGALRTDMSAAVDDKKLTTETTTEFVNFFKNVLGAGGTWNTAADASANYKDSVYVVDAIVS